MKLFKNPSFGRLSLIMIVLAFLMTPSPADAQSKSGKKRNRTTIMTTKRTQGVTLKKPSSPTPISERERTIKDLLYFPFGFLPGDVGTKEEAQEQLQSTIGYHETINGSPGVHACDKYDFTYRGIPIGTCFLDCYYNREWYLLYFETFSEANKFYTNLCNDIKGAGINLTNDKIYGGMSNRTRPVSIFKWVFVSPPEKVTEANASNIHKKDVEGLFCVEFGVYKKSTH